MLGRQRSSNLAEPPWFGLAYSDYVRALLIEQKSLIDFVELPFELIQHNRDVLGECERTQAVLHCSSLSMAGAHEAPLQTWERVRDCINELKTPWLGEHLAFISGGEALDLGFTVAPALHRDVLRKVQANVARAQDYFGVPIILENPPIYFASAFSHMTVPQFFHELCDSTGCGLLLDVTHHYITCKNLDLDPRRELETFPLESVVEIHLSGASLQEGIMWDHHASRCNPEVWELFEQSVRRARPKAVTIEYNWRSTFPKAEISADLERARNIVNVPA